MIRAVRSVSEIWGRWVLANSLAELIGLGATFALGIGIFAGLTDQPGVGPALFGALAMTSSGLIEGGVVGWGQWWAMQPRLGSITRRTWITATIWGALIAWFLGSLPMTIASLNAGDQAVEGQEPETVFMMLMAAAMGLVAGAVLAYPQWRVLRHHVEQSGWWLPANGIAWAAGMPIIFAGIDLAQAGSNLVVSILIMALTLLITGAVVGAIHGYVLVRLLSQPGGHDVGGSNG